MSDLIQRIEAYLLQLSPHMTERKGNQLLREALAELKQIYEPKRQPDRVIDPEMQAVLDKHRRDTFTNDP